MTRLTRRLIFYSLVLIFILATPPTILYAWGYSFDWQTLILSQTGGFYLKSLPADATILIDGKNNKTTPRLISRLMPKTYNVAIGKDGFSTWQKNLTIEPQLVTEARNIILFPTNISPEKVSGNATTTLADFLTSPQDLLIRQEVQNIASSSAGWTNRGSDIFYIDSANFILYRRDIGGFVKEQLSRQSLPPGAYALSVSSNNRFMAEDSQNNLYLLNSDSGIFELINGQVKDACFAGDNKKILIRATNELWVLYLEDILIQPVTQAVFCPDNEHIAFVVGSQIKVTELDGRDTRNTVDLISAPATQIYFDEPSGNLYYLTNNELFRMKLEF